MAKERKSKDPSYIHKNLARFIKMRGMKLSHLGKAVGCSGENIGQKLRGERKLHVEDIIKWCRVLNITPGAAFVEFENESEKVSDAEINSYVSFLTWLGKRNVTYRLQLLKFAKYIESYQEPTSPGPFVSLPSKRK